MSSNAEALAKEISRYWYDEMPTVDRDPNTFWWKIRYQIEAAAKNVLQRFNDWVQCPDWEKSFTIQSPREAGITGDVILVTEYESGATKLYSADHVSEYVKNGYTWDLVRWCVPGQAWVERQANHKPMWTPEGMQACVNKNWVLGVRDNGTFDMFENDPEDDTAEAWAKVFNQERIAQYYIIPSPPARK